MMTQAKFYGGAAHVAVTADVAANLRLGRVHHVAPTGNGFKYKLPSTLTPYGGPVLFIVNDSAYSLLITDFTGGTTVLNMPAGSAAVLLRGTSAWRGVLRDLSADYLVAHKAVSAVCNPSSTLAAQTDTGQPPVVSTVPCEDCGTAPGNVTITTDAAPEGYGTPPHYYQCDGTYTFLEAVLGGLYVNSGTGDYTCTFVWCFNTGSRWYGFGLQRRADGDWEAAIIESNEGCYAEDRTTLYARLKGVAGYGGVIPANAIQCIGGTLVGTVTLEVAQGIGLTYTATVVFG